MDKNLIIYVQAVFMSWMKTDDFQIALSACQGGFHLSDENGLTKKSVWQSVWLVFGARWKPMKLQK